jgi:hypothetical protein
MIRAAWAVRDLSRLDQAGSTYVFVMQWQAAGGMGIAWRSMTVNRPNLFEPVGAFQPTDTCFLLRGRD